MEFRAIRPDEIHTWREFQEYCFHVAPADFDPWIEHKFQREYTRSLFDAEGRMLATCKVWPLHLHLEGARVAMGGIASVASVPENRRGGYAGEMLVRAIEEMKEQAVPLCGLYPFRQSFYRRYGWDVASAWAEHQIPVELLSSYRRASGMVRRSTADQADWRQLAEIYHRWAAPLRGYMVRESEYHWMQWAVPTWHRKQTFYLAFWRPAEAAQPEGYLIYSFDDKDPRELVIREMVALNPAAERGIWGFVANHDSQVKIVRVRLPLSYPLTHLVDDTDDVKSQLKRGWQLRLVDLKGALETRPWPAAPDGSIIIGAADEHAPWNEGTWRVTFEAGRATVMPAPAETPALSANIQTWAQLYAGFVSPAAAAGSGRLVAGDAKALRILSQAIAGECFYFFEFF